jgi:hypothetical protein
VILGSALNSSRCLWLLHILESELSLSLFSLIKDMNILSPVLLQVLDASLCYVHIIACVLMIVPAYLLFSPHKNVIHYCIETYPCIHVCKL